MPFRQFLIKKNLILRNRILRGIREFFSNEGYIEVETPCRIPAPAPESNIIAQPSGAWYLQTSPELCMKRLLASGYKRIFQICKCFRKNERGHKHLPELTMLEWYTANIDYLDMMDQCQELIRFVLDSTDFKDTLTYQGKEIDLTRPWHKISVEEAFKEFTSMSMFEALEKDRFDHLMAYEIEPNISIKGPVFLYDYPASRGALARLKKDNPSYAERFELYIGGIELCNTFSELTDPLEQKRRFEKENISRGSSGGVQYPMPVKFLKALKFMPEAAGCALGIDRLAMLLADTNKIDDVVCFTPEEL